MVTLIYMVAGLSSRFGGKIKQFAEVGPNNETFIELSLNQALKNPFSKIIFIVGEHTEKQFKNRFKNNYKGIPIEYAKQTYNKETRDKPWGTADALASATHLIQEPCIVCNGDDLYSKENFKTLFNHLNNSNEDATITINLINMLPNQGEVTRGTFIIENNFIIDAEENPNLSKSNFLQKGLHQDTQTNINLFALQPNTINKLNKKVQQYIEQNKNNKNIECFLPVELVNLIKENQIKIKVYKSQDKVFGLTNPEDETNVKNLLKNQPI